jgi:type II secretory pathway pseudopilin PulG
VLEVVVAVAIVASIAAASVVDFRGASARLRAASAARFLLTTFRLARVDAARRGAAVGIRFERGPGGVSFAVHVDGDGDGLGTDDLLDGTDPALGPSRRLEDDFPGVGIAIRSNVIEVDGSAPVAAGSDPLRLGPRDVITFTADGASSGGSIYLSGADGTVFAVRVQSSSGRARLLVFDHVAGMWDLP